VPRQVSTDLAAAVRGWLPGVDITKSRPRTVVSAARNVVAAAVSAAWSAIKPGSPSRVFRAIGENMVEGLSAGMKLPPIECAA
jgi:hypothetical protein